VFDDRKGGFFLFPLFIQELCLNNLELGDSQIRRDEMGFCSSEKFCMFIEIFRSLKNIPNLWIMGRHPSLGMNFHIEALEVFRELQRKGMLLKNCRGEEGGVFTECNLLRGTDVLKLKVVLAQCIVPVTLKEVSSNS
jgi:hypothetical protein